MADTMFTRADVRKPNATHGRVRGFTIVLAIATLLCSGGPQDSIAGGDRNLITKTWTAIAKINRDPVLGESSAQAHVVVLSDSLAIDERNREARESRIFRYRSLLVRDKTGVEEIGALSLPHEQYKELVDVRGRVIKPDGTERFLTGSDFQKKTIVSTENVEIESVVMIVPDLSPGDVLEYMYLTTSKYYFYPPPIALQGDYPILSERITWYFVKSVQSGYLDNTPVWRPTFTVLNAETLNIDSRLLPFDAPERLCITLQDVPPLHNEPDMPPAGLTQPMFCPWYKWSELESDFWARAAQIRVDEREAFLARTGDLDQFLAPILRKPRNEDRDIADCLELIHAQFHKPGTETLGPVRRSETNTSVGDLLRRGQGSDSDVMRLSIAMLRRLGYPATTFRCGVWRRGVVLESWRSLGLEQFDYQGVVTKTSHGMVFLAPTLRGSDPRTLPYQLAAGTCLVSQAAVEPDSVFPTFLQLPRLRSADNEVDLRIRIDLVTEPFCAALSLKSNCPANAFFRDQLALKPEREAFEMIRETFLPGVARGRIRAETLGREGAGFTYACSLEVGHLVESGAGVTTLDLSALVIMCPEYASESREHTLDLRYPYTVRTDMVILAPSGARVEDKVPERSMDGPYGEYRTSSVDMGGRLQCRYYFRLDKYKVEPAGYRKFREFLHEFRSAAGMRVSFTVDESAR